MSSTTDFLHRLRQFVQAESDAQWQALDRQWSRPLGERVSKGWTIEGLRVLGFDKNIARLVCDSNHSRFREGDLGFYIGTAPETRMPCTLTCITMGKPNSKPA